MRVYTDALGEKYLRDETGIEIKVGEVEPDGTVIAGSRLANLNPALNQFYKKLATIDADAVDIVTIGDSNTEGGYIASAEQSWTNVLRRELRQRFQPANVPGGFGYAPRHYVFAGNGLADPWTGAGPTLASAEGLGMRSGNIAAGQSLTLSFYGTSVKVLYTRHAAGGDANFVIDGGAPVVVNGLNATTLRSQVWTSPALTRGQHTIVISHVSGSTFHLEGGMIFDGDESAGIHTWQGGHSGWRISEFLAAPAWLDAITAIQPDLVVMMWGTNDYKLLTAIAQFKLDLAAHIAGVRAAATGSTPSIVVAASPERFDPGWTPVAPYADYVQAAYEVCAADGNVAFIDLRPYVPVGGDTDGTDSTNTDKVHYKPVGQAKIGRAIARFVSP